MFCKSPSYSKTRFNNRLPLYIKNITNKNHLKNMLKKIQLEKLLYSLEEYLAYVEMN